MIGKTVAHYKILEKLGEGGMGIVYLAEDTKLDRRVAIKFLTGLLTPDPDRRERFIVEAKAAAALNHPNIAHIYAIEETEQEIFIVMEYIQGTELKDFLRSNRGAPIPAEQSISIAIQIARGLQAAHNKGIIHRDIKSANVMLTEENLVKIMDFGLAKIQGGSQLTKEGSTIGTAAYMSPEQSRNAVTDRRSDIWSYGVILYEMFTGRLPFKGDYEAAILYSILHDTPKPASELNPGLPHTLTSIIHRCLEKNPDDRFRSMDEIVLRLQETQSDISGLRKSKQSDLAPIDNKQSEKSEFAHRQKVSGNFFEKRTAKNVIPVVSGIIIVMLVLLFFYFSGSHTTAVNSPDKKMMVVLPFQNLGPAEQEYFADGITGEITSRLSGLSGLGVIARSSAMQYKNSPKTLQQIGQELEVQYVLEGTIQWEELPDGSKRVRVNPELINISDETQIWSKPYEAPFSNVFKLQADIATQVANALNLTLVQSERQSLEIKLSENSEAYDFYLRGLDYYSTSYDKEDWQIAEKMFRRAIDLDPKFAAAYAQLGQLQANMYWFYFDRSEESVKKSWRNVQTARQLDPDLYLVNSATGWYYYHGKLEYEKALTEFRLSIERQPNDPDAYQGIASVLRRQGNMEEASAYFKKATEIDPRNVTHFDQLGETYFLMRKYEEAEQAFDHAILIAPDHGDLYHWKAWITIHRDGNLEAGRKMILDNMGKSTAHIYSLNLSLGYIEMFDENLAKALNYFVDVNVIDDQFEFIPSPQLKARIYGLMKDEQKKKQYYRESAGILKEKIAENPQDSRLYSSLGIAHAALGQKAEAIRAGQQGIALLPMEKEAWRGGYRVRDMAIIYTMVGEQDKAIDLLDRLLSKPFEISTNLLKLDPTWNPLRGNPRFERLLAKYAKNVT